jgi:hypothetical protein
MFLVYIKQSRVDVILAAKFYDLKSGQCLNPELFDNQTVWPFEYWAQSYQILLIGFCPGGMLSMQKQCFFQYNSEFLLNFFEC